MNPLLRAYRLAGCLTDGEVLSAALLRGSTAFCEARAIVESGRENSTAMVIVPGDPPGKNVCGFIRRLVGERSKLIVAARQANLQPGQFERLLRASMPDVEKKLRIMDVGSSIADAVMSAERNRHYRPSQALEVFAPDQDARNFAQEVRDGSLNFDPTVISVVPVRVPSDNAKDIERAVELDDLAALHRVLDPHIFSSPEGINGYKSAMNEGAYLRVDTSPASVAGLCLVAKDTLRVLMLQRALCDDDPAGGTWEFPGGHMEPDENPLAAAYREWQEEVGILLPAEYVKRLPDGSWLSSNGVYVGAVVVVPDEECIGLKDREQVTNPDDPDGDSFEAVAWWDIEQLLENPALRPELDHDIMMVVDAIVGAIESYEFFCEDMSGVRQVNELVGTQAAPQAGPQSQMRASNSSAWSGGRLVLKKPEQHVPEDKNESERDRALDQDIVGGGLDWGIGLNKRGY